MWKPSGPPLCVRIPLVGSYETLWLALGLVALGGRLALLLVREPTGRSGLAPLGGNPLTTLTGSVSIMRRRPRVAIGAAVRVVSTGSPFGFLVCLPFTCSSAPSATGSDGSTP